MNELLQGQLVDGMETGGTEFLPAPCPLMKDAL